MGVSLVRGVFRNFFLLLFFVVTVVVITACENPYTVIQVDKNTSKMEADKGKDDNDDEVGDDHNIPPPVGPKLGQIYGKIKDAINGRSIKNVKITLKSKDPTINLIQTAFTDENGKYDFAALMPGAYLIDFEVESYIPVYGRETLVKAGQSQQENLSMTGVLSEGSVRITMIWTREKVSAVKDVDSYLQISGVIYPLGYLFRGIDYHGAFLDRDDTDWMGPETITIHNVDSEKTYHYYVNNYNVRSESEYLGNSEVQVTVYMGSSLVKEYKVPQGSGITYSLFRIENGVLVDTEYYDDQLMVFGTVNTLVGN